VLTVGILALIQAARVSLIDSVVHVFRPSRRARGARG